MSYISASHIPPEGAYAISTDLSHIATHDDIYQGLAPHASRIYGVFDAIVTSYTTNLINSYTTLLHRAIACAFLLLCSLLSQTANAADSIDQVGVMLAQVSGAKVRGFSTRDFGRDQYPLARSVLVSEAKAPALLKEVRRRLPPGFIAFIGTSNILGEPPVTVAELIVAPGRDQFDILRVAASDAVNYDMLTEDLVKELQAWHREFGIDIWQADTDTISLDLKTLPTDVEAFAKRVYKFCPDIVDQSTGKLSDLVRNIRAERQVYLWWD